MLGVNKRMLDQRLKYFLHVVFWAYMFLSPMQYLRGTGIPLVQYLMNCMSPLLLMVVFYVNYIWLTPKYFVKGKHRYFLIINTFMVFGFALLLYYWMDFTHEMFQTSPTPRRTPDSLDIFLIFVRDTVNFIIFATAATCIKLAQQWYWAEKALKDADAARIDAELSNLRNQINPHFLLNTLNNIYALTAFDTQKAQESIQELSKMLRHILYDYQEPRVPLQDETEFIDNYVKLMRIRLPNSVEVVSKFHVLDKQADVAPMIFISLVENAFKHGVSPTEPSFIHITIEGDRKHVICDIKNSNYPKAEGDHSGHGIGLQQVQRRLELSYYQQYTWEYGVSPDGKTFHSRILITPKRK
jgi:hypothetical protein